tara:strand:+ start:2302 stop:2700 length:399 start_codon:yes stop_codon:yes gene_type:complete
MEKTPDQLAAETIKDPKLRDLYSGVHDLPYQTIIKGQKLLKEDKEIDRFAVLQAIQRSAEVIVQDIGEHGDANIIEYGNHDLKYFKDLKEDFKSQADKCKIKTDVFKKYFETSYKASGMDLEKTYWYKNYKY